MKRHLTEHNLIKILLAIWFAKSLFGLGGFMDGFVILVLVALNVFMYFQDQILKSEQNTKKLENELNGRIMKLENQVSQLSLQKGFQRGQ